MAKRYRRTKHSKKSDPSWKSLRKKFRLRKRLRRFGLVFFVFLSVLMTLGILYIWYYFTRPFAQAGGSFDISASWQGKTPLNLLWLEVDEVENDTAPLVNLSLVVLNPTLSSLTIINLPLECKVYLPSQGEQPLKAIYGVGNLLDPKQGIELAEKNVSYLLGVPIDGYLLVGSEGLERLGSLLGQNKSLKEYFSLGNISFLPQIISLGHRYLRTNLPLDELGRVSYFIYGVREDKIEVFALSSGDLQDQEALDLRLRPFVRDAVLAEERIKIQILNGTIKAGLAAFAARLVENMGGEVIRIGNYERQDITKGFLVLDESGSYTARRLSYLFGVVDSRPPRSSTEKRAEINLILGLDNYQEIF